MTPHELNGLPVRVHRNLHTGQWSVSLQNKVVAQLPEVHLRRVTFRVSEKSRQRVLRDKQKNVHAWAEGVFSCFPDVTAAATDEVTYDPYSAGTFRLARTGRPVYVADVCWLSAGKAYIPS